MLVYWSLFWLLNSLDKFIGGSHFLWVGRDRFAQFHKFFASAGLDAPIIADLSLIVAAGLEVFAFVFFTGALIFYLKKSVDEARTWFFVGIALTLIIFTIFAIGDHVFGDRFELLEHTLFWFITLISWVVCNRIQKVSLPQMSGLKKSRVLVLLASIVAGLLLLLTNASIFNYKSQAFVQRSAPIDAEVVGENLYKVSFPFLGGSTVFEKSIALFKETYPNKRIDHIYTVPDPLRLKKADALIFYIITTEKK